MNPIKRLFAKFPFAALLFLIPIHLTAAPTDLAPIAPDRPGFTNGSDTVQMGLTELEIGIAQTKSPASGGGAVVTDYPEALVRRGVSNNFELRLSLPNYFAMDGASGYGDGSVGVKWKYYQSKDGNTKAAITPAVSLPTRNNNFSSGTYDPSVTFGIQQPSGSRWAESANLTLADPTVNGRRVENASASVSAAYQITTKLGFYGDIFDGFPKEGAPTPIIDGGFTFVPKNNIQWDAEAGVGLGGAAPVKFIGGGMAIRF